MVDDETTDTTETAPEIVQEPVPPVADEETPVERNEEEFVPLPTLEARVAVGSTLTRTKTGWHVGIMFGGAPRLHGDGATLDAALIEAGV